MTPGSSPLESQPLSSQIDLKPPADQPDVAKVLDESTLEQTVLVQEVLHATRPNAEDAVSRPNQVEEGNEEGSETLDPLRIQPEAPVLTVLGGDISDTLKDIPLEKKPSPASSNRRAHLHLNLKPPSPQPWDLVDPPDTNDAKETPDYYSTLGSRKFRTLQSTTHTRPLIPKSSYYFGPPPSDSAFYTPPIGHIGLHHPREIVRIERDYTGGELVQFAPIYPVELEGREMKKLQDLLDGLNVELYNPVGLNILWPRNVAFLYLEIEYYVSSLTPAESIN
ncbi:hypothetical protein H0H93_005052 [Arthromyces matolae]|nr:hypothetical protein H0H93_005052 [Arthromyces matolae]